EFGTEESAAVVAPLLRCDDAEVRAKAIAVLARVGGQRAGETLLAAYPMMSPPEKARARDALFGRKAWAQAFLDRVAAGEVSAAEVPVDQVRRLALLGDPEIDDAVRKHWGRVAPGTAEEKLARVRRFSNDLRAGTGDAAGGKALFVKHCATCHTL